MSERGHHLEVRNFAQIDRARIDFGDLTVLVGPQGSGKSLLLQFLKLAIDKNAVSTRMFAAGLTWRTEGEFIDLYLGEGMKAGLSSATRVETERGELSLARLRKRTHRPIEESVLFIPAHRALLLTGGWPQKFERFNPDTPVVARLFSDSLQGLLGARDVKSGPLFPAPRRLKEAFREKIDRAVFHGGILRLEERQLQRRLELQYGRSVESGIPFMAWTAGQREFAPLLLGLSRLLPAGQSPKNQPVEWVIIEEPEMGLHPRAIETVMFLVLELLRRKFRVVLSTHSTSVLSVVWTLRRLKETQASPNLLLDAFALPRRHDLVSLAVAAIDCRTRVFALHYAGAKVSSADISTLDPGGASPLEASWGELTEFSGRMTKAVAAARSKET